MDLRFGGSDVFKTQKEWFITCFHSAENGTIMKEEIGRAFFDKLISQEVEMHLERKDEAIDRTLLNHLLKMFTALGIYSKSLEKSVP
ncbi:hypothetical protein E3N88_21134 [Mikania micrantha]|uniref:Uncharacterized protein n=1 Tax=Mikania micrantha TaxID=192012 RepID=A0A5N6NIZ7_9ASTR|nr:hypothetical protein E3N88_21134 [Mikania micrantha]